MSACGITPAVNQVEFHVYYARWNLKKTLHDCGTQIQSWGSFTEGKRRIFEEPLLRDIGSRHGKTAGQTALRYLVQQGVGVIPKSSHRKRMKENLDILDFRLTPEEMKQIQTLDEGQSLFGWYEDS